ncbi:MAG: FAD-dependent oxidoreductase [Oscillospiraceae bacterium]
MLSVWKDDSKLPEFEKLRGDLKTDVLIIGGGMAGILCAYMLEKEGVDYALVEAETICSGITGNTTAKITSQHGLIYDKLVREFSVEQARMYLSANEAAIKKYRELCADIDCGFETKDSCVYSLSDRNKLEKEMAALGKIGYPAELIEKLSLPLKTVGAVKFSAQAQFDPLRFVSAIAKGLSIYEHTKVLELIGTKARTENGMITANTVVVTTHFPFINKHGSYFLKMYQHRSCVIALENAQDVGGMYVDEDKKGMSFRNYGGLLLLGGGGHRTGKQGGGWSELESFAERNYPEAAEKYRWAAQDCMTLDGMPYVGHYSKKTPELLAATGFNKWGMSSAMVSATILTDMLLGRKNEYASLFSPSRSILRPQLALNVLEAAVNLLTPSKKRCPHLGCALKWNSQEHTWDCPCHGSRFTEDGKLIDNPATGDMK